MKTKKEIEHARKVNNVKVNKALNKEAREFKEETKTKNTLNRGVLIDQIKTRLRCSATDEQIFKVFNVLYNIKYSAKKCKLIDRL